MACSSVHRAWNCSWIQLDLTEGGFVAGDVLLQDGHQRLRLLRTEIDALKVPHIHLALGLLLQSSEYEEEIPHVDPHLDAIRVILPVVFGVHKADVRLRWSCHRQVSLAGERQGMKGSPAAGRKEHYP
jgi:hypothetical protein